MSAPHAPAGYSVRPATWDDLHPVAEMLRVSDLHDTGRPDMSESELRADWRQPGLDLDTDTWVVHDGDGAVAAYTWQLPRGDHTMLNGWGTVRPEHRGRGVGALLVDLFEERAAQHRAVAAPHRDVTMELGTIADDPAAGRLLEERGFRNARQFWRMEADVDPGMSPGDEPAGISVRPFDPQTHARGVHAALTESFEGQWGWVARPFEDWAVHRIDDPDFDPSVWFVALDGDEVVGALVGAVQTDGLGWVNTLGVRPAWRGRGVAGSLLRHAFAAFGRKGLATAALGVDSENETGATRLYERVGMHVTHRYDSYVKVLPGQRSS
jgi:mycothiol synthase